MTVTKAYKSVSAIKIRLCDVIRLMQKKESNIEQGFRFSKMTLQLLRKDQSVDNKLQKEKPNAYFGRLVGLFCIFLIKYYRKTYLISLCMMFLFAMRPPFREKNGHLNIYFTHWLHTTHTHQIVVLLKCHHEADALRGKIR